MTKLSDAAVRPLATLDPAAPLDDLAWLDEVIGDARVVAIGESAHYNRESYLLRHRLLRYLVERHGFGAYAMESGFTEGWLADDWVRGGADQVGHVMANGITSLMGMWTEMRDHLAWMRAYNAGAQHPIGWYGIDLGGSNVSLLPSLDAALGYLAPADPEYTVDKSVRGTAAAFSAPSAFSVATAVTGYGALDTATRDACTAGLADIATRMTGRRLEYVARTGVEPFERALRSLYLTITLDSLARAMAKGDRETLFANREAAIADTIDWILRRTDRIVLAAHDAHVQRWPAAIAPGMPSATPMGMHTHSRLGSDYVVIGTTTGAGHTLNSGADFFTGTLFTTLDQPKPGSLDALMAATYDAPFATDLRRLSDADMATVRDVTEQRFGDFYSGVNAIEAYDVIVHLPTVTAATIDADAVANAPEDVRTVFTAALG